MYIHEAVASCGLEKPFITRKRWMYLTPNPCKGAPVKIQPTNSPDGCIVESVTGKIPHRRWTPTAEDLVADDWILVG
ncbi:Thoeris anti-defense Tad2 family protein [Merdimmobilis hominis]